MCWKSLVLLYIFPDGCLRSSYSHVRTLRMIPTSDKQVFFQEGITQHQHPHFCNTVLRTKYQIGYVCSSHGMYLNRLHDMHLNPLQTLIDDTNANSVQMKAYFTSSNTMTKIPIFLVSVAVVAPFHCRAFQNVNIVFNQARDVACNASRRDILSLLVPVGLASSGLVAPTEPSFADDNDLTAQMFNSDGSLKEGYESEVKYRDVKFTWDQSDSLAINQDGMNVHDTKSGSQYTLSYRYPMRWSDGKDGDPIYFDRNQGINKKATKGITLFQAQGTATDDRLEKATTIGIAKALDVPKELSRLFKADVISGRTVEKGDQKYFEFDMASAPDTCGNSNENLGLGFCPYGE